MKKTLLLCIGLLTLVAAATAAQPAFTEGAKAPALTVERLDGQPFKLAKERGRVVVLSFWATWCGPCMRELGEVPEKILRRFDGRPVAFLAIDKGEPRKTVERKVAELKAAGIEFPVAIDPYDRLAPMQGDGRIPRLVVIDRRGVVRLHAVGYTPERLDEVAALIESLLDE